jgi:hypothetical protein
VEAAAKTNAEPPAAAALLAAWMELDLDGNGTLSVTEAAGLKKMLHIDWNFEEAWDVASRCFEPETPGSRTAAQSDSALGLPASPGSVDQPREISFGAFVQIFSTYVGAERRKNRIAVKKLFDKLDADHSGTLNKKQFAILVKNCRKKLSLLPPEFNIDRDWGYVTSGSQLTDPSDQHLAVSWSEFERWWKNRCGVVETNTPIIPEYHLRQLQNRRQLGARSTIATSAINGSETMGSNRWRVLRPQLVALAAMNLVWRANDANLGAHGNMSAYARGLIPRGIRDPESTFSVVWDIAQMIFLLYVSIVVPYRTCFGVEIQLFSLIWFWDTIMDVYFLADIVLNFRTAYVNRDGMQVVDPKKIAHRYLKGWFVLDAVSCIPVGHISRIIEQKAGEAGPDNVRLLKTLRLLRMSKMLRLARIRRILQKYESLMVVQEYLGLILMILSVVFVTHVLTCLWYVVGLHNQVVVSGRGRELGRADSWNDPWSATVLSWVHQQPWFEQNSSELIVTHWRQYLSSMYFVLNALDGYGQTDNEKVMGVVALVFTMLIRGAIAGIMSAMLISLGGKDQEMNDQLRGIKKWLLDSRVQRSVMNKTLQFFGHQLRNRARSNDAQMLEQMPPGMQEDFRRHIYTKVLQGVPIFSCLSHAIISALRQELTLMVATKGQVIFEEGSIGSEMCTHSLHRLACSNAAAANNQRLSACAVWADIVMAGELEVTQDNQRLGFLPEGAFFGEVAVLDEKFGSERTRTVTSITDSQLCIITAVSRAGVGCYPKPHPD